MIYQPQERRRYNGQIPTGAASRLVGYAFSPPFAMARSTLYEADLFLPGTTVPAKRRRGTFRVWHALLPAAILALGAGVSYAYYLFAPHPPLTFVVPQIAAVAVLDPSGQLDAAESLRRLTVPSDLTVDNNLAVDIIKASWPWRQMAAFPHRQKTVMDALQIKHSGDILPISQSWVDQLPIRSTLLSEVHSDVSRLSRYAGNIMSANAWNDEAIPELAAELDKRIPSYEAVIAAADKPYLWVPSPDSDESYSARLFGHRIPHINGLVDFSVEMIWQANRLIAAGKHRQAWAYQRAVLQIGHKTAAWTISPIERLVASQIDRYAYRSIVLLANATDDLALLEEVDLCLKQVTPTTERLRRGLQYVVLEQYVLADEAMHGAAYWGPNERGVRQFRQNWNRELEQLQKSYDRYAESIDRYARHDYSVVDEMAQTRTVVSVSPLDVFRLHRRATEAFIYDPFSTVFLGHLEALAIHRLTRLQIHTKRHPDALNTASWDVAIAAWPDEVGIDPYSGQPLISMALTESRRVLYPGSYVAVFPTYNDVSPGNPPGLYLRGRPDLIVDLPVADGT